jgi:hypothetical protein
VRGLSLSVCLNAAQMASFWPNRGIEGERPMVVHVRFLFPSSNPRTLVANADVDADFVYKSNRTAVKQADVRVRNPACSRTAKVDTQCKRGGYGKRCKCYSQKLFGDNVVNISSRRETSRYDRRLVPPPSLIPNSVSCSMIRFE